MPGNVDKGEIKDALCDVPQYARHLSALTVTKDAVSLSIDGSSASTGKCSPLFHVCHI